MKIAVWMIIIIISHLHQQKLVHEESYTEKECQLWLVNSQHNQSICSCMYMHAYYIHETLYIQKYVHHCWIFLNQVCAGHRSAHAWFLKIVPVQTSVCICVCVCPPPRLLITSGMIWTPYNWLNKFYSRYMAIIVVIINGHGLGIDTCCRH